MGTNQGISFYVVGLSLVGLLVSSRDERLLNAANPYSEGTSPFVLAAVDAGLEGYNHFMNFVICVSVVSLGVSCVYGGSRTLSALANQGYAPKIFTYVDKSGRPLMSVLFLLVWGALAYIVLASSGSVVFDWLLALSGLAALFTWGSICLVSHTSMPLRINPLTMNSRTSDSARLGRTRVDPWTISHSRLLVVSMVA